MLNNELTKEERIYLRDEISILFASKCSFICYPFRVVFAWIPLQEDQPCKVLISIPKKKLKHAVDRNRMKRLFREAYRQNKHHLIDTLALREGSQTLLIGFVYLPNEVKGYTKVVESVSTALDIILQKISVNSESK